MNYKKWRGKKLHFDLEFFKWGIYFEDMFKVPVGHNSRNKQ